jgi:hypothetical protein
MTKVDPNKPVAWETPAAHRGRLLDDRTAAGRGPPRRIWSAWPAGGCTFSRTRRILSRSFGPTRRLRASANYRYIQDLLARYTLVYERAGYRVYAAASAQRMIAAPHE